MQVQVASGITTCQLKLYQAWDTAIIYLHLHNFDLSQYHLILGNKKDVPEKPPTAFSIYLFRRMPPSTNYILV